VRVVRTDAVETILAAVPIGGTRPPVVLIDGFSGAGKTTLADALVAAWSDAALVRLESIYPGWQGLRAASDAVHDGILVPHAAGRPGGWVRWDWTAHSPAEHHRTDPARPLVVEGVGALARGNRALASLGVWVELYASTRKRRALVRDGDGFAAHWDEWAGQERDFAERERPRESADLIVDMRS